MSHADFTPYWPQSPHPGDTNPNNAPQQPATVPSFQFKNQSGATISDSSLRGHLSVVSFFFTSCGNVCPRLISRVQEVQKKLGTTGDLRIYSFSVAPQTDSPEQLASYAKSRKLDLRNWDLITGERDAIYRLGRETFRADRNPDGTTLQSEFILSQAIYLVDENLRIRGVYQSDKGKDIKALIEDAGRLAHEQVASR
jgi:protein SCO1/2